MYISPSPTGRPPLRPPPVPVLGQWASGPSPHHSATSPTGASLLITHGIRGQMPRPPTGVETILVSPPHRPVTSSWQDRGSDGRSTTTTSDMLKHCTAIEMIDLEDGSGEDGCDEHVGEKGVAFQLAQAMGAEKFHNAFHELHPDGFATLASMMEVFSAAGLQTSEEDVEAVVAKLCPEVTATDSVPYPRWQEVFFQLQMERQRTELLTQELAKGGWLARWMATDDDATNLLLVIVVSLCSLSAFLAAGVAILLLFLDSLNSASTHLQDDLGLVKDIVEVFALQISVETDNVQASTFITTLSTVLDYIGHINAVESTGSNMLKLATAISYTIAAWLTTAPTTVFINYAALAAALANTTLSIHGLNDTAHLFDELNPKLSLDYEIVLARWKDNTTAAVEYLTQFRLASQCPNGVCITNATVTAPMRQALLGNTFAQYAMDYTGSLVLASFTNMSGLGIEVKMGKSTFFSRRTRLITNIMQTWTSDSSTTYEFLIANKTAGGAGSLMVPPNNCDAACRQKVLTRGWPMYYALLGQTGVMQFTNHRGAKAMAAYMPVEEQPLGLVVQVELSESTENSIVAITSLLTSLNSKNTESSEEFELATFQVKGANVTITHLTPYRYGDQCPLGKCMETAYMRVAAKNCSTGAMRTTDYRNVSVVVGYSCISELNVVLSYKVDVDDNEADTLQAIVNALNARTAKDTETSSQYLLAKPNTGLTAQDVTGYDDFVVKTEIKYPDACVNPNCTWNRESALRALQDKTDVIDSMDYRRVAVESASARSDAMSYGVGLALEVDSSEVVQPIANTAIKIGCFAIGMVAGSVVMLILITKLFLRSMITAKEEGKKVVQREKDRFSKLVASMYPVYVVPQLLAGEKQMVCEVPEAAVFFSDIHEFTSVSNAMGSKDLLLLMGYVYGVMDRIADRFGVYKVKTIGDAYLAVLGLPGCTSPNVSLGMLRFASSVCQVFGDRFVHPTEGQVMALMNSAMSWNARPAHAHHMSVVSSVTNSVKGGGSGAHSVVTHSQLSGGRVSKASTETPEAVRGDQEKVQCVMSYGLSVGKVVAGVLAGRSPMFDIWGNTVNLASRMQSTGEPGRIQVSEQLYKTVIAEVGQPFSFEAPHSVFCKGFGHVNAYMVRTTAEGLPKDLQAELKLEPQFREFFFDNMLSPEAQMAQVVGY